MPSKPILLTSPGSHHSRRVALIINELALEVEQRIVDVRPPGMGGENEQAEFLRINPFGKVPVLLHGDIILTESNAIMNYLAEWSGYNPFWPADLEERAQIMKWQFFQAAHLSPAADGLLYENTVKPMLGEQPDGRNVAQLVGSFRRCAGVLEQTLEQGEYLIGDHATAADLSVSTALMYARAAQIPMEAHPRVMEWHARLRGRPSWKATEPPPMGFQQ